MKTESQSLKGISRVLLVVSALLLTLSIFVPIWRIELDAPQYPEGLVLKIHASKLGGNVDIINGLNHYIGMKTLHAEDFIEFTLLPYLIGFYALFAMITGIAGRKKILYALFTAFVLFGVVAMVDFWRWEYNYGHNLDPNAAIIVPGMAYQPPLIGFKQLLNFGAFSVPDAGGWLFVASGILMLLALIMESKFMKGKKIHASVLIAPLFLGLLSCNQKGPEPVKLNTDNCDYCKMTISDARFASELVTSKGRAYKFDDVACMKNYLSENNNQNSSRLYVADYNKPEEFLNAQEAFYASGEAVGSPMGGNAAAFKEKEAAEKFSAEKTVQILNWNDLK